NVACGGTLVQDIPSEITGALPPSLPVPPNQSFTLAHEVWLQKEALLSPPMRERLGDNDSSERNSRHHHALKTVAPGFIVSATAPDGVLEAVEDLAALLCLGVHCHPDNLFRAGDFSPLFEGLVEAVEE